MTIVKFQRRTAPKMYRQELLSMWSARHLMMLYISLTFHDTVLIDFQVIEQTQNYAISDANGDGRTDRVTLYMYALCTILRMAGALKRTDQILRWVL